MKILNQSKEELLAYFLDYKADMWGFGSDDYLYWEDYLKGLSFNDLIEELLEHYLINKETYEN